MAFTVPDGHTALTFVHRLPPAGDVCSYTEVRLRELARVSIQSRDGVFKQRQYGKSERRLKLPE
jgi:hypothetical protein